MQAQLQKQTFVATNDYVQIIDLREISFLAQFFMAGHQRLACGRQAPVSTG